MCRFALPFVAPHQRVGLAMLAVAWGGNEFTPLLVYYRQSDHLSATSADILLAAYVLGLAPALFIGGPASDRLGRRVMMRPAMVIAVLGSIALALGGGSQAVLFGGRVLSGIAQGLAMVAGTTWIKELSSAPWEQTSDETAGARRATIWLTVGFGLGAALAALLAQFAPEPGQTPYALNILLTLAAGAVVWRAPETRAAEPPENRPSFIADLRVPTLARHRFITVVLPLAPWVFGSAATAYAILPALLASRTHGYGIVYAGLLCLITLSCGVAIQPLGQRLDDPVRLTVPRIALLNTVVAMALAALVAATHNLLLAAVAAAAMGCGYGLILVGGLAEVQRMAGPDDLAGLTAVFYALCYTGFFVPMVLTVLDERWTYPVMLLAGSFAALACLVLVTVSQHYFAERTPQSGTNERTSSKESAG